MQSLKKFGTILVYSSLFGVIISAILAMVHVTSRPVFKSLITVSLVCSLCGYIILLFAPVKTREISKSILDPAVYMRTRIIKLLASLQRVFLHVFRG